MKLLFKKIYAHFPSRCVVLHEFGLVSFLPTVTSVTWKNQLIDSVQGSWVSATSINISTWATTQWDRDLAHQTQELNSYTSPYIKPMIFHSNCDEVDTHLKLSAPLIHIILCKHLAVLPIFHVSQINYQVYEVFLDEGVEMWEVYMACTVIDRKSQSQDKKSGPNHTLTHTSGRSLLKTWPASWTPGKTVLYPTCAHPE